jgi:hypothetical protein
MHPHTMLALAVVGIVLFAVFVPFGEAGTSGKQTTLWEDVKSGKLHFPTFTKPAAPPLASGALTINIEAPTVNHS